MRSFVWLVGIGAALAAEAATGPRFATLSDGWKFRLAGEQAERDVRVPHDWGIEKGFLKAGSCPGQGDLPFVGKGFYRRAFDGFTPPAGGRTYLTLDGVQCRSVVKLNGKAVGGRPFGYASETIDVTDALLPSGNVLEVEAENVELSSRWYPGSGIFRDVTVRVCPRDHVKPNTLFVRTLRASANTAQMQVSFEWTGGTSNYTFAVHRPRLWSPEKPELYELELFGEKFRYGIRTAVFDPQKGFFLNGVQRQMRGVCLHHDLGPVGAAFDRDVARRQLTLLKEMGCDAIRTSHNPPAAALLDLCDEMGVLVMDEAFDMWEVWKGDYSNFWKEWHARDLAEFVRRDRSHPCVVMWSIGNELGEFCDKTPDRMIRIATELNGIVKANDTTRPVTFGCWVAAPMTNGCQNTVDAFGANYMPFRYAEFSSRNPKVGLVATETASTVSSRGEYFFPVVASPIRCEADLRRRRDEGRAHMIRGAQMSGYDLWGPHPNDYPPDVEFEFQEKNPQVYGEFVWTGFDYLGEPDPCAQSGGRSSYFGIFDLAGFPKDRYWLYKAQWCKDEPCAHILPHWNWAGREGLQTPVHVYSSGDEAELFVNGVSQGRLKRGACQYRFEWNHVKYQAGELSVKTWRKGKPWAEDVMRTAGAPASVAREERRFGRLAFVTLTLKDKDGNTCPDDDRTLSFATKPGTRLVALCNGDPASRESFRGTSMKTFHGLLLAIVEGPAEGLSVQAEFRTLEAGFRNPPNEAKPHLWWHWMNGNVSKEGLTADLEAMAEVGIGGAQVFDAGCGIPAGPVAFNSPKWFELFEHAGREAKRLGLELCHANCSGWSSSGGPWITADRAMKILCATEKTLQTSAEAIVLERPKLDRSGFYRDIAVLAFPVSMTNLYRLTDWQAKAFYNRNNDCVFDRYKPAPGKTVARDAVLDITDKLDPATGRLAWKPPAKGWWKVLRVGYRSIDRTNHPASEKGVGLEVDKLSEEAVRFHMDQYCAKLVARLGDAAGNVPYGLNNILVDSYEVGSQNWTHGFEKTFEKSRGYALTAFLPLLTRGYAVGSVEESERFLEDFRRVVADEFAKNYCAGLAQKCHELGLRLSVEPYGNCPSDNLQYGAACDIPTAEFWSHGQQRNADQGNARIAAHVAHANGRRIVAAEAFSADPNSGGRWTTTPFSIKREGDCVYAAGVNRIVYHRFVHQPWKEPYLPGLTMGRWGMHFERCNTWWYEQKEWLKYQARCQWMLMEGRFCADVLCYYGEGAPNVRADWYYGICNPKDVPEGFDYDQCARDTILGLAVRDRRVVNAAGVSYAVLALPPDEAMSLEVLRKLEWLADQGATICGLVKPTRAPGLRSMTHDDLAVKQIADRIWGTKIKVMTVEQALKSNGIKPDCLCGTEALPYSWIHRRGKDGTDWYFVATQNAEALKEVAFTFRPDTRTPELWNPETGAIERARKVGKDWRGRLSVTLDDVPPDGSMFIVFRGKGTNGTNGTKNPGSDLPVAKAWRVREKTAVQGPWRISFPTGRKAPASATLPALADWTTHEDAGVRYFSGTATYEIEIPVPAYRSGERVVLDLGDVRHFAQVTANGKAYPTLWRPPFRQDVTDALKVGAGTLKLAIRVTNLWPNRLIGDERECPPDCEWSGDGIKCLPGWVKAGKQSPTGRVTFTTWHHWRADDELLPSGILGPATLQIQQARQ